jgi:thymidylate synthase (FAD)
MTKAILVSKTMVDPTYLDSLIDINEVNDIKDLEFYRQIQRDPEQLMVYIARVSSPKQTNPDYEKLLKYCWKNGHYSVFEQVQLTMEVETDLNVATQCLRHQFKFQMLSRRYSSDNVEFVKVEARRQDLKNRQSTIDDLSQEDKTWFTVQKEMIEMKALNAYEEGLKRNIGKEVLRYLLPTSLKTKLYISGPLRNFITYVKTREANGTQKEHIDLALEIKKQLKIHFPVTYNAVWEK